jgi:hypothetical protein
MNDKKNHGLNGVNVQILNTVFESVRNQTEGAFIQKVRTHMTNTEEGK